MERVYRQALKGKEKAGGPEHFYTDRTNGQVDEAKELLEHIDRQKLADDHPDRISLQHKLAEAYQANGELDKAIELFEHIVRINIENLKEDHPVRLASQYRLAEAYEAKGQDEEAIELLERHPSRAEPPDLAQDILILKHQGATYPLYFTKFDIADGHLKVGELRRTAAKNLEVDDPRRIKLLYKGKSLLEDRCTCKEEGLKQNSELFCVVSSDPQPRDDSNEASSSESRMQVGTIEFK